MFLFFIIFFSRDHSLSFFVDFPLCIPPGLGPADQAHYSVRLHYHAVRVRASPRLPHLGCRAPSPGLSWTSPFAGSYPALAFPPVGGSRLTPYLPSGGRSRSGLSGRPQPLRGYPTGATWGE